jgi:hypothetical protein
MKRIMFPELECTDLEIERYKQCQNDFGQKGYLYYITEWCPGAGYEVVYSTNRMNKNSYFDESTMRIITDTDYELEVF